MYSRKCTIFFSKFLHILMTLSQEILDLIYLHGLYLINLKLILHYKKESFPRKFSNKKNNRLKKYELDANQK